MQNHGVTIYLSDDNKTDLKEILNAIGERGKQSVWKISGADCIGETSKVLHEISDESKNLSGEEFYNIVSGISQVIDGDFKAYRQDEAENWILIRAIRGDEFDVETKDAIILKNIRDSFKNVKDLIY